MQVIVELCLITAIVLLKHSFPKVFRSLCADKINEQAKPEQTK